MMIDFSVVRSSPTTINIQSEPLACCFNVPSNLLLNYNMLGKLNHTSA